MSHFYDIVDSLYASSIGFDAWDSFLRQLYDAFPGTKVSLVSDALVRAGECAVLQHGYDDTVVRDYVDHYSKINPWNPHIARLDVMVPALSDDILPSHMFRNTQFYAGFIEQAREVESGAGLKLFDDGAHFSFLNIHYGTTRAEAYNRAFPQFLKRLAPHLQNAVEISRRTNAASYPPRSIAGLVDQFNEAAFLLDPRGVVIDMNERARALLDQSSIARLGRGDRLCITNAVSQARLDRRLATSSITPVVTKRAGRPATPWKFLEFLYSPMESRIGWFPSGGKWIVALFDVAYVNGITAVPKITVGLTQQETNVARALMNGLNAKETATALGISYHTVRQHLKAVFAKTNTSRQAQLVAALAGMADNAQAGDEPS